MENKDFDVLRRMEADEARARRRGVLAAWGLVGLAVVVLAVMLVTGANRLSAIRAQTLVESDSVSTLLREKQRLTTEIASLRPLVENYRTSLAADSANIPADTQAVVAPPDSQLVVRPGPDPRQTASRPPPGPPARVYLQVVTPGDRAHAAVVGERLERAGFQVLGTEYVARAPRLRNTELRYYKKADEPDAQRLLQALRAAGEESAVLLYLGLENNTRVRPRHYEVWFAAGAGQPTRQPVRRAP